MQMGWSVSVLDYPHCIASAYTKLEVVGDASFCRVLLWVVVIIVSLTLYTQAELDLYCVFFPERENGYSF